MKRDSLRANWFSVTFSGHAMKRLLLIAALCACLVAPVTAERLKQTEPDPSLSPQDVVRIQMEALRDNDTPYDNRGIEVTFNFASPANKRLTGPIERFTAMVHHPVYAPMINHRSANFENQVIEGELASVDVVLMSEDGEYLGYRFTLSRQRGNSYEGSWMTDGVVPFEVISL